MVYELWDLETGNAVGDFQTEADALDFVRWRLREDSRDSAVALAMLAIADDGEMTSVAEGEALLQRALAAEAHA